MSRNQKLLDAAKAGDGEKVLKLLAEGADVNAEDEYGMTPLHEASDEGHAAVVEALLANGADVDAKDKWGQTPLLLASYNGHAAVVEALLAKGADVSAIDRYGDTPLDLAKNKGRDSIVEMLGNVYVHRNNMLRDQRNRQLLDAAGAGDGEKVLKLLAEGADVDAKDEDGWTPLHEASDKGHAAVVEALLAKGADIEANTKKGSTPLHHASFEGHVDMVEMLLVKGADVTAKTNDGETPLDLAKTMGNESIVEMIGNVLVHRNNPPRPAEAKQTIVRKASTDGAGSPGFPESPTSSGNAMISDEQRKGNNLSDEIPLTIQVNTALTYDDLLFLKMGRGLVRDGGAIPVILEEERSALQTLTTNIADFERSLESVRELPETLADKGTEVADYFFFFTGAFERTYVAAQAISTGHVEHVGLRSDTANIMLEGLLGGVSWAAEKSNLPFLGCISIFSAIIMHQRRTMETNALRAFETFFRGNSRDQYLITYRRLAEEICLRLECSSMTASDSGTMGRLKQRVKKIVEPIRDRLRKVHLDSIQKLSPVEEKAMLDLASVTQEVLRLHQDEHDIYHMLRISDEFAKASHFIGCIFGTSSCAEQVYPSAGLEQANSSESLATKKHNDTKNADFLELNHLSKKIQSLEEQNKRLQKHADSNANVAQELKHMQSQFRRLAAKVKSEKELTVSSGRQAQVQINPRKHDVGQQQELRAELRADIERIERELHQVQIQQEKQSASIDTMVLDNFITNRVLTLCEAFEFVRKVLSLAKVKVSNDGRFVANDKQHCIGEVCKGRFITKRKILWKGNVKIKLEQEHQGVSSIVDWFDGINLRPLYERYKKKAIRKMFSRELNDHIMAQPYRCQNEQNNRNELFDVNSSLDLS